MQIEITSEAAQLSELSASEIEHVHGGFGPVCLGAGVVAGAAIYLATEYLT